MDTQVIKISIVSICLTLYSNILFCQQNQKSMPPFIIISDISKTCYHIGDTICFKIKNVSGISRGYTLEAICVSGSESVRSFNREKYTAYFNNDTTFFINLKHQKQDSEHINYLIPSAKVNSRDVAIDSSSTFLFVLKGKQSKKGVKLKFRIIPDIIQDEQEYVIETKPFLIFLTPE